MPTPQPKLVVRCTSISIAGYAAGLNPRMEQPFGDHTDGLHAGATTGTG